jgi:two-component system sensor histidine kinase DesK
MNATVEHARARDEGNRRLWQLFNLLYLLLFFTGWLWQPPGLRDVLAATVAVLVFLPVYFHAYERSEVAFIPHIVVMELLAWGLAGFAGIHGVFHVYACVQAAFQQPRARAISLIGGVTLAYGAFALATEQPLLAIIFNTGFGLIIGIGCIGQAESLAREQQLKRSRELERQHATLAERERIAHELHDLLGQTLTSVALKSDVAARLISRDPARARREIAEVADAARGALAQVRAAVYDMTATSVESEVVLARQALEAAGIRLEVARDIPPLDPQAGKVLGLVIREATTNIVRHSGADNARIRVGREAGGVALLVTDDGVGAAAEIREGAGLGGIRKRVEALGGETSIEGAPGMRIRVWLPVAEGTTDADRAA